MIFKNSKMICKSNKMKRVKPCFKMGLVTVRPYRGNYFSDVRKIGEGVTSKVYVARYSGTNHIVTLKKRPIEHRDIYTEEFDILSILKHENVIKCHEILYGKKYDYMVIERMDCDLRKIIRDKNRKGQTFSLGQIKTIIYQLLKGLNHCQSKSIIHRDLKPANILVDKSRKVVKITDFGLSMSEEKNKSRTSYTNEVVTLWYRAPEILLGMKKYSFAVDMWSVGCIFAELISMQSLFTGNNEIDQLLRIFKVMGTPDYFSWTNIRNLPKFNPKFPKWIGNKLNEHISPLTNIGKDLLHKMLVLDPSRRITVFEAMNHSFFNTLE